MLIEGGVSKEMFNYFIIELIRKYKENNDEDRLILVFDNARIHHNFITK